ncbi:NADH-quinone oxidoreductase subunit NuoF [Desulfogranum marinum]|jgi:NADH-quinone oxidoreductase subunit F|uniref:NADH-quinone oxidoreductase subunit NuoF n=1 Tax=Desulfogranum marinum TaxID=453220 RepID=UPI00196355F6|nr:NADH-quinone oxidoreductase subunit NuoF [Desulfogranum marinum]MBM9512565.1 NADH-quinone oxidoreductase subunit NuoF [Desulfogranum marinum]
MEVKLLSARFDVENCNKIEVALKNGAYSVLDKAFSMEPGEVTDEVKNSGLRGRGGAGFPTGLKWTFLPKQTEKPVYLAVNSDESEPGTFKDRYILVRDPHMLIEGIIISCYAIGSHDAYIYIRGEYTTQVKVLQAAIDEAYEAGYLGDKVAGNDYRVDVTVHRGAGAYICGEETALLESIEGKKGQPRSKPPFPAVEGLYGCPTIINNVQSIASVPYIVSNGADAYKAYGTEKSPGTHLFGISGLVEKPGMYELPLGLPILEVIEKVAGGVKGGKKLKGVIPGGSSTPVLLPEELETVTMDYESMAEHKTMFGSGGMVVLDEDVDVVKLVKNLIDFYHHESCGQCTPCREGLGWMLKIVKKIINGDGTLDDVNLLRELCDNIEMKTVCVLSAACTMPVRAFLDKFRHEFEAYVQ